MGTSRKATDQDAIVGRLVQRLRKRAGKTQEMLARDLGITYQQLGKYERGESGFRFTTVCRIAGLLGVPVSLFIDAVARPGMAEAPAPYEPAPPATANEDFARAFDEAIRLWRASGR